MEVKLLSLCSWDWKQKSSSVEASMSKQSYLGATLLTPHGEEVRKGTLNIVCFLKRLAGIPHPAGSPLRGPKRQQKLNFGTWNVRTLIDNERSGRPEARTAFAARELQKYDIDIAALQETRRPGEGQLTEGGYTFYWKGKHENEPKIHGIGFAIKNELIRYLKIQNPIGINERLMTLCINLKCNRQATVISAYAPTLVANLKDKEKFYSTLDSVLANIPRNHKVILLGDFNARVGRDHTVWQNVIGKEGVGNANANGICLLTKCAEHQLVITNTLFRQKNRKKTSWKHPSGHWHMIDYVIVRCCDKNDVLITKSMVPSDKRWTDHKLIRSSMKLTIRPKRRKHAKQTRRKFNFEQLPEKQEAFERSINEKLPSIRTANVNDLWNDLKNALKSSCDEVLRPQSRHHDWFDDSDEEIRRLIDQKREYFSLWQTYRENVQWRKEYRLARSAVQKRVRKMKNWWWTRKAIELQALSVNNSKAFFAAAKKIYEPKLHVVTQVAGEDRTDVASIRERWREHFSESLNQNPSVDNNEIDRKLPQLPSLNHLAAPPTLEEVTVAIDAMKNGKATGLDGIAAEACKAAGPLFAEKLHFLLTRIWEEEVIPSDLRDSLIVKIFKKGDKRVCDNYRGIHLLSVVGKIFAWVLACPLNYVIYAVLSESQWGFKPLRKTVDMIFSARQLQEKCRNQNKDLYIAFIDLKKAFESVHRPTLWKVLSKIGCPEKYIKIVRLLHDNMTASVLVNGEATGSFEVRTGVKQGCVLAPVLFSIFVSAVLHLAKETMPQGVRLRHRIDNDSKLFDPDRLQDATLTTQMVLLELQYADVNAIVSHTEQDLQAAINAFNDAYTVFGLTIDVHKTKILYQPSPNNSQRNQVQNITVNNESLSSVEHFPCLESCLSRKAVLDVEIYNRLNSAAVAVGRLRKRVFDNKNICNYVKLKVYKAIVLSTLLYGSETWTTYTNHLKCLEEYHQRCIRCILKIKWQDNRTNISVLEEAGLKNIKCMLINKQLRWAGHTARMPESRLPKRILYAELVNGERNRRQKQRWKDSLKKNMRQFNIDHEHWEELAQNRARWRQSINNGVEYFERTARRER